MALYQQDCTHRGEKKSYTKLQDILRLHLEKKLLDKNKSAWCNSLDGKAYPGKGGGKKGGQPGGNPRVGDCRQWRNEGKTQRQIRQIIDVRASVFERRMVVRLYTRVEGYPFRHDNQPVRVFPRTRDCVSPAA